MSDSTLKAKLSLDTTPFQTSLKNVRNAARDFGKSLNTEVGSALKGIAKSALITGLAAVGGLIAGTIKAAEFDNELRKAAKSAGMGVTAFSEYAYAAGKLGMEQEALAAASNKLQKAIADANSNPKSEAAKSLAELGLSVKALYNLNPAEQLEKVGRALGSLSNRGDAIDIGTSLFGREGGAKIAELFAKGGTELDKMRAKARSMGAVISPEQAENAKKLSGTLSYAGNRVRSLFNDARLFASMTAIVERFNGAVEYLISTGIWNRMVVAVQKFVERSIDYLAAALETWDQLDDGVHSNLIHMGETFLVVALGFKTGLLQPFITGITRMVLAAVGGFSAIGKAGLVLMTAFAGLTLGQTLEQKFNLGNWLLKWSAFLIAMGKMWDSFFSNLGGAAILFGQELIKALTPGEKADFSGVTKSWIKQLDQEFNQAADYYKGVSKQIDSVTSEAEKAANDMPFLTIWKDKIKEDIQPLGEVVKNALGFDTFEDILGKFDKNLANKHTKITTEVDGLDEANDKAKTVRKSVEDIGRINVPFRGITRILETVRTAIDTAKLGLARHVANLPPVGPAKSQLTASLPPVGQPRTSLANREPVISESVVTVRGFDLLLTKVDKIVTALSKDATAKGFA